MLTRLINRLGATDLIHSLMVAVQTVYAFTRSAFSPLSPPKHMLSFLRTPPTHIFEILVAEMVDRFILQASSLLSTAPMGNHLGQ